MRLLRSRCARDLVNYRAFRALACSTTVSGLVGHLLRAVLSSALLLSPTRLCRAEELRKPLVVIVDSEDSAMTRRLRQELEALGFLVQSRSDMPAAVDRELGPTRAVAVIEIKAARPGSVSLSMVDPQTAQVVRQALPIEAAQDPNAAELVATRTVELLRAARLDVHAGSDAVTKPNQNAEPVVERSPSIPPVTRPEERAPASAQLLVGAGMGLSFAPEWTWGSDVTVGAAWLAPSALGLVAELALPVTPARFEGSDGDIDAFCSRYRLGVLYQAFRERPFGLRIATGAELEQLSFRGRAEAPYVNVESHLLAWAPWLRVAGNWRATRSLRVVTAVTSDFTLPRTVVNFGGREVSHWGRPGFSATVGAEWSFP